MEKHKLVENQNACACPTWVTGPLVFHLETDRADEQPLFLRLLSPWPKRTALTESYVRKMAERVPGAMEIQKPSGTKARLILRVNNTTEMAYHIFGVCSCGRLLLERDRD